MQFPEGLENTPLTFHQFASRDAVQILSMLKKLKPIFCQKHSSKECTLVSITWTLEKQKNTTAQNIILQPTFTHIEEKKVFKSSECLMQGHYTIPLCLKNTIIHFICRVSQYWYISKDRNWSRESLIPNVLPYV